MKYDYSQSTLAQVLFSELLSPSPWLIADYIMEGLQWTWVWVHFCCPFLVFLVCSCLLLIIYLSTLTSGNTYR